MEEAGYNTFLLRTRDVFLNMLAAMMVSDDAYAGPESSYNLAAEHLLAKVFIKPGDVILMNYHFTTTRAHF